MIFTAGSYKLKVIKIKFKDFSRWLENIVVSFHYLLSCGYHPALIKIAWVSHSFGRSIRILIQFSGPCIDHLKHTECRALNENLQSHTIILVTPTEKFTWRRAGKTFITFLHTLIRGLTNSGQLWPENGMGSWSSNLGSRYIFWGRELLTPANKGAWDRHRPAHWLTKWL